MEASLASSATMDECRINNSRLANNQANHREASHFQGRKEKRSVFNQPNGSLSQCGVPRARVKQICVVAQGGREDLRERTASLRTRTNSETAVALKCVGLKREPDSSDASETQLNMFIKFFNYKIN